MKWNKLGQIFNPTQVLDKTWMKEFAQCTSAVAFDDFVRVYFSSRPPKDTEDEYVSYTSFVDFDKSFKNIVRVADKPILELGGLGSFDEFGIYPTCVFRHNFSYLLYYAGWTRPSSVFAQLSIGTATSVDGVTFNRLAAGPIMSRTPEEPLQCSGPKVRIFNNIWYMYYLSGIDWLKLESGKTESIYKIRMAISNDGINWCRLNRNIIPNLLEDQECQAGPDVFFKDGQYHMYFSYRYGLDFRNNDRGYRIGYARSTDAINWVRDDQHVGIGLSDTGWDSMDMHYPHVFELDNKTYMLYNGNEFGKYGFGLAILDKEI